MLLNKHSGRAAQKEAEKYNLAGGDSNSQQSLERILLAGVVFIRGQRVFLFFAEELLPPLLFIVRSKLLLFLSCPLNPLLNRR